MQDDQGSLQRQLNAMASIYANARITIIASGGQDANYGLRGIRGISQPRERHQDVFMLPKGCKIIGHVIQGGRQKSTWDRRAWTFQEDLFSRRRLVFSNNGLSWECPHATWPEDLELIYDFDAAFFVTHLRRRDQSILSLPWPNLATYFDLVCSFNTKQLTYEDDIADAFAGITASLGCTFEGGFLWGLPEMFFDVALLWQPEAYGNMEIRIPNNPNRKNNIPSWSWMGWRGEIARDSWNSGSNYFGKTAVVSRIYQRDETIPILQWYIIEQPGMEVRPIVSPWRNYKDCVISDQELPLGWTKHRCFNGRFPNQDFFFKHESDPMAEFWYPMRIRDHTTKAAIRTPGILLACRTQRAWLRLASLGRECHA